MDNINVNLIIITYGLLCEYSRAGPVSRRIKNITEQIYISRIFGQSSRLFFVTIFVPFGTMGVYSGILLIAFFSYAIWKFEAYSYADIIQFCYCQTFVSVPSLGGNVFECFLLLVCLSSC